MEYVIATRDLAEQPIVSIRDRRRHMDIPTFLREAFGALFGRLGMLGVTPASPPFVIYHEFGPDEIDAEVCVPIAETAPESEEVRSRVLPAMQVAGTLHVGRYEKLTEAYAALTEWIARNGLEASGPVQERYLNGPGDTDVPEEYRTEVEIPIAPAVVAVPG